MASFNRVIMIGNLTRDPDYKQAATGRAVCNLSLASNRQFRNEQTGMLVQEVCYIDIEVWGKQADNCRQYLQKGRPVLVEGRLKLDTWESEGQTKRRHKIVADRIVFLGSSSQAEVESEDSVGAAISTRSVSGQKAKSFSDNVSSESSDDSSSLSFKDQPPFEDDLPF